jgi:hypothetical protein
VGPRLAGASSQFDAGPTVPCPPARRLVRAPRAEEQLRSWLAPGEGERLRDKRREDFICSCAVGFLLGEC